MANDVIEYLVDGTSGIGPGNVSGTVIVAGVSSAGTIGKGYLLGKRSDIAGMLGVGPLVDRLRDIFATGGQEPVVIAVPVEGMSGGYIGPVTHTGSGPEATASGSAAKNADAVVTIVDSGAPGVATAKISTDGGATFGSTQAVNANGQIPVGDSGATLVLAAGDLVAGDTYAVTVRTAIGPVRRIGNGPEIVVDGTARAAADIVFSIVSSGGRNTGTYRISVDGGDSWSPVRTIPFDGILPVVGPDSANGGDSGLTLSLPDAEYPAGTEYHCTVLPPVPSVSGVMAALEQPLELYDVESVYVVGPTDAADWAAMGAKADELWNSHRPTYFKCEYRLPYEGEDLNDWAAAFLREREQFSHRFVLCVTQFGEVSDVTGKRVTRNWAGLQVGRNLGIPVHRATGRVLDGPVSQGSLPEAWNEAIQCMLENAGAITAKRYRGLRGAYWGDSRTLAEDTSDFRFEEVLRTVFKAARLSRVAALRSLYNEAGDPVRENDASRGNTGLAYLKTSIENALGTMSGAIPNELAGFVVTVPPGQDIVNNGAAVEITLIGIPIIRKIKLFMNYTYAGSAFDPRITGTEVG